jgi:disulfide bond formation protein DsbB
MIPVVITFLAALALGALLGSMVLLLGGRNPRLIQYVGPSAVSISWVVAVVATLGSLFLSEIAGFYPCVLCWVQRGFMYPLAVVLLIPTVRRSRLGWLTFWALAGAAVSVYHYLEQHIPGLAGSDFCSPSLPCSTIWVTEFGFVTIPFMAGCGFLAIAALNRIGARA